MPYLPKNLAFLAALTSLTTSLAVLPTLATAQQSAVDEVIVTGAYRATAANALKMPIPLIDVRKACRLSGKMKSNCVAMTNWATLCATHRA